MAWSAVNGELWRSADMKVCPANTALGFICLLKAARRPARAVGFLRRSLPDDILDVPADLFDRVYSPYYVKMLILFDYLRLDQSNMRLSASLKPAKQPPSINEIIG